MDFEKNMKIIKNFFETLNGGKPVEDIAKIASQEGAKKYSFETVFWVVAWLQFLSFSLISVIEYLNAVGLVYVQDEMTRLLINLIKGFNIIVIGAMIKFFTNVLDYKTQESVDLREQKENLALALQKTSNELQNVKKECSDAEAELIAVKTKLYSGHENEIKKDVVDSNP